MQYIFRHNFHHKKSKSILDRFYASIELLRDLTEPVVLSGIPVINHKILRQHYLKMFDIFILVMNPINRNILLVENLSEIICSRNLPFIAPKVYFAVLMF